MNNRNLRTFETKLATSETLAPHYHRLPDRRRNQYLRTGRSHASFAIRHSTFLVGQSLTRQANVTGGTRVLLSPGASLETGALFQPSCVRSQGCSPRAALRRSVVRGRPHQYSESPSAPTPRSLAF
ncbi:hypothetical protein IVA95_27670 [Bradyrhizobium sp. 157]|nr:hypothetical protein [Bradyrhizobium sp. 157]